MPTHTKPSIPKGTLRPLCVGAINEISKEQAPHNLCNEFKSNNQLLERAKANVQIGPPLGQLFLLREEWEGAWCYFLNSMAGKHHSDRRIVSNPSFPRAKAVMFTLFLWPTFTEINKYTHIKHEGCCTTESCYFQYALHYMTHKPNPLQCYDQIGDCSFYLYRMELLKTFRFLKMASTSPEIQPSPIMQEKSIAGCTQSGL